MKKKCAPREQVPVQKKAKRGQPVEPPPAPVPLSEKEKELKKDIDQIVDLCT